MPPRILYLAHRLPYPPNRGDRIRAYHTLRFLASRAEVYVACLNEEPRSPAAIEALEQVCHRVAVVGVGPSRWLHGARKMIAGRSATEGLFYSGRLQRLVNQWVREIHFDAAIALCSSMYPYARVAGQAGVPLVVDLVDVDSQKWFDYAADAGGWKAGLYQLEGRRVRSLERELAAQTKAVTLVSHEEAELFRQRVAALPHVLDVTNGVDLDFFRPANEAPQPHSLVFVGVLDYRPNVEGLRWFCRRVWPELRRRMTTATLSIVGRRPVPAVQQLGQLDGVRVIGEVDDVRPYVSQAAAAVAPLQIARGVQNKVLEAMAMGRPVVATSAALEGLSAASGVDVICADTADSWVEELVSLLNDADRWQRLSVNGRAYVERSHSWEACLQPLENLLGISPATNVSKLRRDALIASQRGAAPR